MLFSQDKNKKDQVKKQSTLGFLFNPRLGKDIAPIGESFQMFTRMIAMILASNRLLSKDHPALQDNNERVSMREVVGTAWNNLSFTKEGLPQVALFFAVFGCLLFSALFVITFIFSLFVTPAHAAETGSMFTAPAKDYATSWIDFVFLGKTINNFDGSASNVATGCSFQAGISSLLGFYSSAMLVLGGFILIYHLTSMIVETANSGKFMGRANQVWAPIRLVVAIGLLIPLSGSPSTECNISGYNTGQYLVMRMAKFGSAMASQGWSVFLDAMKYAEGNVSCTVGSPSCLKPSPEARLLVNNMINNYACVYIYNHFVTETFGGSTTDSGFSGGDFAFYVSESSYKNVDGYSGKVTFGQGSPSNPTLCGGYGVPLVPNGAYKDSYAAQATVFNAHLPTFKSLGEQAAKLALTDELKNGNEALSKAIQSEAILFQGDLSKAVAKALTDGDGAIQSKIDEEDGAYTEYGWLTAGAWFNTIARKQTERSNSVLNGMPSALPATLPSVTKKKENDEGLSTANQRAFDFLDKVSRFVALPNNTSQTELEKQADFRMGEIDNSVSIFDYSLRVIDKVGGWSNLWDSDSGLAIRFDKTINPLAEIAAFGQSNVRMGTSLIGFAALASIASKVTDADNNSWLGNAAGFLSASISTGALAAISGALGIFSAILTTIACMFFAAGMVVGYLLPLFPFFRFFFGSVTWLLNILGAVVGAPLFALAHLNPYGEGLPGQRAGNGYFYILQIFLRPTLMILGLVAGFLVFSAAITFLNSFFIIVAKGTGAYAGSLPTLAKLIYTFIYCGIVYLLADTCFRTIGFFPQTAMQWFGGNSMSEEKVGDPGKISAVLGYVSGNLMQKTLPGIANAPGGMLGNIGKHHNAKVAEEEKAAGKVTAKDRHEELVGAVKQGGRMSNLQPPLPNMSSSTTTASGSLTPPSSGGSSGANPFAGPPAGGGTSNVKPPLPGGGGTPPTAPSGGGGTSNVKPPPPGGGKSNTGGGGGTTT